MPNSRYCKVCKDFHDLSEDWPEACMGHYKPYRQSESITIIKDIEPYKAVASDIATGKPPVIAGRAQHREFLKRNGYFEIGTEKLQPKPRPVETVSKHEIKRAIEEMKSR